MLGQKFGNLFGGSADKQLGIQQLFKIFYGGKSRILLQSLYQIVGLSGHPGILLCRHGMYADLFVQFLSVTACFHTLHQYGFRSHERYFLGYMAFDNFFVNYQSVSYVHHQFQNTVCGQESFAHDYSAVRGIVQRSFKTLYGRRMRRVYGQRFQITTQRANAFRTHRVPLVCHCGRTYLFFVKRFFYFFTALQQANILSKFICALCNSR